MRMVAALSTSTLKPSSSHGRSGRLRETEALGADADPSAEELHGWQEAAEAAASPATGLLADMPFPPPAAPRRSQQYALRVCLGYNSTLPTPRGKTVASHSTSCRCAYHDVMIHETSNDYNRGDCRAARTAQRAHHIPTRPAGDAHAWWQVEVLGCRSTQATSRAVAC